MKVPESIVKPSHVLSIDDLEMIFENLKVILEEEVDTQDMEAISEKLSEYRVWFSYLIDAVPSAKWYYQTMYNHHYQEALLKVKNGKEKLYAGFSSPSMLKDYMKSKCADFIWLESKADRMYSALVHSIDVLRSQLSKQKEIYKVEMFNSRSGSQGRDVKQKPNSES